MKIHPQINLALRNPLRPHTIQCGFESSLISDHSHKHFYTGKQYTLPVWSKMSFRAFSEKDLSCPVCCDVYRDPVILGCSHSICKSCLEKFWETKGTKECPYCKRRSSKEFPPLNLALKNLCEAFAQEESQRASEKDETLCDVHHKELTLFCLDDQQPLCSECCSKTHFNHRYCNFQKKANDIKVS